MTESVTVESPPPRFFRPELDQLRFFAFVAVFLHHALPQTALPYRALGFSPSIALAIASAVFAGKFGVDLFFVLSAYLITELLVRENKAFGTIDVGAFYLRRLLRIWPLYYVFIVLASTVIPYFRPTQQLSVKFIIAFAIFAGNWACALRGFPASVAAPLWSVSIEEQFYFAWPVVLKRVGIDRLIPLSVVVLLAASATRVLLTIRHAHDPAVWCNTFARADPIACGALVAAVLAGTVPRFSRSIRVVLGLLSIGSLWLAARYGGLDGARSLFTYPLIAIACTTLLLSVLGRPISQTRIRSVIGYLGRISYGLYVFHMLAIRLANRLPIALSLQVMVALVLTIGLGAASYQWLELPFLRIKQRFSRVPSRKDSRS